VIERKVENKFQIQPRMETVVTRVPAAIAVTEVKMLAM
jgi:hypothetical protein